MLPGIAYFIKSSREAALTTLSMSCVYYLLGPICLGS